MTREPSAAHFAAAAQLHAYYAPRPEGGDTASGPIARIIAHHLPYDPSEVEALVADIKDLSNRARIFSHEPGCEWLAGYADEMDTAIEPFTQEPTA